MSLNRYEQAFFAYLESHPDEHRHWQAKVARLAAQPGRSARSLAEELWDYARERAAHAEPFREWAERGGVPRSSLLNLAEYLLRIWGPPVVRKPPADGRRVTPP